MKRYLRLYIFNLVTLWLVGNILEGVNFRGGYQTLALAALALSAVDVLIKPLINLLLLPINLLTLGMFRWLSNVIALYLVTKVIPKFEILGFNFPGFSYHGFVVPRMFLTTFWVFVITSFLISLIISFLLWLTK